MSKFEGEDLLAEGKCIYHGDVEEAWIDYNGHMNISGYTAIFSNSLGSMMSMIGIDEAFRNERQISHFSMEMHVNYFSELTFEEKFNVYLQILDYDQKRAHVFLEIYKEDGTRSATGEILQTCVDLSIRKTRPFPEEIYPNLVALAEETKPIKLPKEAGSVIGIRRK